MVGLLVNEIVIPKIPWVNPPVVKAGVNIAGGGPGSIHSQASVPYLASSNTL